MRLFPTLFTIGVLTLAGGFYLRDQIAETRSVSVADTLPQTGDIIFQSSAGGQSEAIKRATNSKWTHCGMIIREGNDVFVLEAIEPVSITPFHEFVQRGTNGKYCIKRLKKNRYLLTDSAKNAMAISGKTLLNKHYDLYFGWSEERYYCSELVWKLYQQNTGLEIGKLQALKEFNLADPVVKNKMKERYGKNIPYDEKVISPEAIFNSDLLEIVVKK